MTPCAVKSHVPGFPPQLTSAQPCNTENHFSYGILALVRFPREVSPQNTGRTGPSPWGVTVRDNTRYDLTAESASPSTTEAQRANFLFGLSFSYVSRIYFSSSSPSLYPNPLFIYI